MNNNNSSGGFVSLHRSILNWEWYGDLNTCRLFIHLLLTANFRDQRVSGRVIRRGQRLTSLQALSEETGLTLRQVRTSLNHLKSTGEVTSLSNPQGTVITVKGYTKYQQATHGTTGKRHTSDKRATNERHTTLNKDNKENKEINKPPKSPRGEPDVFSDYAGENAELLTALRDFEQMRRKNKSTMTDKAKKLLCTRLDKLTQTAEGKVALLNEAILHCWKSVYLSKEGKQAREWNTPDYYQHEEGESL